MKKLHYIFPIIAMLFCNVAMATTNKNDVLWATNLVVWDYNNLPSGRISMYHGIINMPFNADIASSAPELEFYGTKDIRILTITDPTAVIHLETGGGGVSVEGGSLTVQGNITATGWVSAATNILWQTNIVWSTNAVGSIYATNAPDTYPVVSTNMLAAALADTNLYKLAQSYYPTNESVNVGGTNVLTDMAIPYADVNWVTNMYMGRCTNLSTTNYQTAVRMIHGGPATGANIGFDSTITQIGTWRFTNYAVITFFYNPATPSKTNALCVPMY